MEEIIKNLAKKSFRVVGTKQVLKGLDIGKIRCVIIAKNADEYIKNVLMDSAKQHNVEIKFVDSMNLLATYCGVDVKTATAGLVYESLK